MLKHADINKVHRFGYVWGLSIVLEASEFNLGAIQDGPPALLDAATYYFMATDETERRQVIRAFVDGVEEFRKMTEEEALQIIWRLEQRVDEKVNA